MPCAIWSMVTAAGFVFAAGPGDEPNKETAVLQRLGAIEKQLDETKKANEAARITMERLVSELQQQRNYQELKDQLAQTQRDLLQARSDIQRLTQDLSVLRTTPPPYSVGKRELDSGAFSAIALAAPVGPDAPATTVRAKIVLTNQDFRDAAVIINGKRYPVAANTTIALDYTPGDVTYSVIPWRTEPTRLTLKANDTQPIKIYTLPN